MEVCTDWPKGQVSGRHHIVVLNFSALKHTRVHTQVRPLVPSEVLSAALGHGTHSGYRTCPGGLHAASTLDLSLTHCMV